MDGAEEEAYDEEWAEGAEEEGAWEEGGEEEEGYDEAAAAPGGDGEEGEEAAPKALTEEEEIAQLEADGWVNTSKIRGPPTRLAPKPPPRQEGIAKGKVETWQGVKSDRNWAEDVDLSQRETQSAPGVRRPASETAVFPASVTDKYELGPVLGSGSFSVVRQGKSKATQAAVALKLQSAASAPGVDLAQQAKALALVANKAHLPQLVESIALPDGVCNVVSLVPGHELLRALAKPSDTPWTERDAAAVVKCVLEALAALHEARVVHLNVTTENIVFDAPSGGVVVEGLTLSRMAPTDAPITTAIAGGTLQFQAPEIVFNSGYSFAADVWSAGVVAHVLLTGALPFTETHPVRLKVAIKKGVSAFPDHLSADARSFLQALLAVDQHARPTARAALQLPFVQKPSSNVVPNFRKLVAAHHQ